MAEKPMGSDKKITGPVIFPAQEHDWLASCEADPFAAVRAFLSLFRRPVYMGEVVVLNGKCLRNRRVLGIGRRTPYVVFRHPNLPDENELVRACVSHGHLSVLFVSNRLDDLVDDFLSFGYYEPAARQASLDAGVDNLGTLVEFSAVRRQEGLKGCLFCHDAAFFYVLQNRGSPGC